MIRQIFMVAVSATLVGCGPEFKGKAEFIAKTSEVQKALAGKPARIWLREKLSHPMSNAYERVTFGGGRFTNQLDVVKALVKSHNILPPFVSESPDWPGSKAVTNEYARLSVDETPSQPPVLRMEADIAVWLSQTNVLARALSAQKVEELFVFSIDPQSGELNEEDCVKYPHFNLRQFTYKMMSTQQYFLLTELFGSEKDSILTMVAAYAALPAMPNYISDQFFTIVGDSDEPLGVEAKDVVVDGRHHATFKASVKRGETLRLKLGKGHNLGGIRFHKES